MEEHGLKTLEFVTGGALETDTLPLVIAVHGLGGNEERFGALMKTATFPMRVVAAQGVLPYGQGFSWFDTTFANGAVQNIDEAQVKESARRLTLLARDLKLSRPSCGNPIIIGFSQGGVLAYTAALLYPNDWSLAVPLSGTLPKALLKGELPTATKTPKVEVVAFHGGADSLVPSAGARKSVELLKKLGLNTALKIYPTMEHTISLEMRQDFLVTLRKHTAQQCPPTKERRDP